MKILYVHKISRGRVVSFAAVFRLVTSRNPPPRLWGGGLRDVTSLKTAAKETRGRATQRSFTFGRSARSRGPTPFPFIYYFRHERSPSGTTGNFPSSMYVEFWDRKVSMFLPKSHRVLYLPACFRTCFRTEVLLVLLVSFLYKVRNISLSIVDNDSYSLNSFETSS